MFCLTVTGIETLAESLVKVKVLLPDDEKYRVKIEYPIEVV